ncbi:MAG: pepsin/retropepsin-like aspartic protease family protein, partial [Acidobacteriota bacterium]
AILVLAIGARAVSFGAALSAARKAQKPTRKTVVEPTVRLPDAVSFHEVTGRGLLIRTWVNGAGPFSFAIDTGAGATILSPGVAAEARVKVMSGRATSVAGLSGESVAAHEASVDSLAIGDSENYLPAKGAVIVATGLPRDLDGVLDPTEAFSPLGYVIDLPRQELAAFDPRDTPVRLNQQPPEGTVVPWLRESHGRRPFVMLDTGERALLDTGSSLGFAVKESSRGARQRDPGYEVRDVGGGRISTRRGEPATISIGSLTLRRVPTDIISGAEADAPVLLGLNALRPFRLRFDPLHRLIEIAPVR